MRVRVAHISLQYTDSDKQTTSDITKIFDRAASRRQAWITGTESGPGAGNTGEELVRIAREAGYRPWVPEHQAKGGVAQRTDCWLAVREDLIEGEWKRGFDFAVPSSGELRDEMDIPKNKSWGPKGLVRVSFESTNKDLGRVSIGSAHYITDARTPKSPYWDLNEKIGKVIGDWAKKEGKGKALVFYGGDQNMADNRNDQPQGDTFFGHPLESTWDAMQKWENTGHGCIDVIASYNKDRRVQALRTNALSDREFHLHTDHFYVEAAFEVEPLKKR